MHRIVALALVSAGMGVAQSSSSISLSNGATLRITSTFGQPEMAPASGNSFYRVFRDHTGLVIYAYELAVDRSGQGREFRLIAKPAGNSFAARFPNADGGKPSPTLSEDRELPPLTAGQKVSIDVFELPGSGPSAVDTIELQIDSESKGALRFDGLKVSVNQKALSVKDAHAVSGRYVMFYIPGRGGYFFATEQQPGYAFVQAGSVDHGHLQFTLDNESFDCTTGGSILTGSDRGEVWAFHDPGYAPSGNWTEPFDERAGPRREPQFFTAGSNTLAWWLAPATH